MSFKDGDKVSYSIGDFVTGVGIVRGLATVQIYGIGNVYILEDTSGNLPNATYPFKFFTCFEINLKSVS